MSEIHNRPLGNAEKFRVSVSLSAREVEALIAVAAWARASFDDENEAPWSAWQDIALSRAISKLFEAEKKIIRSFEEERNADASPGE